MSKLPVKMDRLSIDTDKNGLVQKKGESLFLSLKMILVSKEEAVCVFYDQEYN